MLPTITLLGRTLPTYGVLAMAGVLLSILLVLARCRRYGIAGEDCLYLYAFGLVGAMLGAKVLYLLLSVPQLISDLPLLSEHPALFLERYVYGGMVFYGGVMGALVAAIGCARYFGWKLRDFFPVIVPALPLGHALGRVGCFSVGCCYGAPVRWGIAFSQSPLAPNGVKLMPVQLLEAGADVAICLVLLFYARRRPNPLRILGLYFALYAPVRFALEFFRGDAVRGFWGVLSTSQWISVLVFAAGVLLLARGKLNTKSEYSLYNE